MDKYFVAIFEALKQRHATLTRQCEGGKIFIPARYDEVIRAINSFGDVQGRLTISNELCPCANVHTSRMWDGISVPDFDRNIASWIQACTRVTGADIAARNPNYAEIKGWFESILPVHLCDKTAFLSILSVGGMGSLDKINRLWKDPKESLLFLLNFDDVKRSLESIEKGSYDFLLRKLIRWEFRLFQAQTSQELFDRTVQSVIAGVPADKLSLALNSFRGVLPLNQSEQEKYNGIVERAYKKYGEASIKRLCNSIRKGAKTISDVLMNTPGIGFSADKETLANKQVFAILGPNMGKYGNREVAIVFKRDCMRHPDFFMTPFAAMGYYQGWYTKNSRVGINRPWGGEAKPWDFGGRVDYQLGMFQAVTRDWSRGCALEWIARVAHDNRVDPNSVTLRDVQDMIHNSDPHTAVEVHLSGYVPLEYIQKVYIKRGLFDSDGLTAVKERVDVVETDDPAETVYAEMCRLRRTSDVPRFVGYKFSAEPWSGECTVPLCLPKRQESVTQFVCSQKGIDMWICLREVRVVKIGNTQDRADMYERPESSESVKDEVKYIEMCAHITDQGVTWHASGIKEGMDSEHSKRASKREGEKKFSSDTFKYRITINPSTKTWRIEVWEVLGLDSDKKMGFAEQYEKGFAHSPMFLSFATNTYRANIADLTITPVSSSSSTQPVTNPTIRSPKISTTTTTTTTRTSSLTSATTPRSTQLATKTITKSPSKTTTMTKTSTKSPSKSASSSTKTITKISEKPITPTKTITKSPGKSTITTTSSLSSSSLSSDAVPKKRKKSLEEAKLGTPQEKKTKVSSGSEGQQEAKSTPFNITRAHKEVIKSNHVHLCKSPFTCEAFLYNRNPLRSEHSRQFSHVCLYGQSCSMLGDPEHRRTCIHLKKDVCKSNPCKKLTDPSHRAMYHHPGLWDYLIPCRHSTKCKDASTEHLKKYQHEARPVFPPIKSDFVK